MDDLEPIGDYLVCQNSDGDPISLRRVAEEIVCLGFDPKKNQIVEIHVIADTGHLKGNGKLSFLERAWNAGTLTADGFPKILAAKEDNGLFYYVTDVSDGEFLTDYILRNGPLSAPTAIALVSTLVESLIEIEPHYRLLLGLRLKRLMIVMKDSAYLSIRAIDLGLARPDPKGMNEFEVSALLAEISQHLFHLLTGRSYSVGRTDVLDQIKSTSPLTEALLAKSLEPDASEINNFEVYLELLSECYDEVADGMLMSSAIVAYPQIRPRLTLQREIFEKTNLKEELEAASFTFVASNPDWFETPYTSLVTNANGNRGRLLWYPPNDVSPISAKIDGSVLAKGFRYLFIPTTGLSLLQFLVQRNHQPDPIDVIRILNELAQQIDSGEIENRTFTLQQLWIEFSNSGSDVNEVTTMEVASWPEFRIKVFPVHDTAQLLCPPPNQADEVPAQHHLLINFISAARNLLCESSQQVHKFLDQCEKSVKSGTSNYQNCASLLMDLADQLDE